MPPKPGSLPQVLMALWRYCDFHCQILNASFLSSSISFITFLPVVVFWNRHLSRCCFLFVIEEFSIEHKYVYSALSNLVVFARSTLICEQALLFEWRVNWATRERVPSALDFSRYPLLRFSKARELWSSKAAFTSTFFAAVNHNYDYKKRTLKHRKTQNGSKSANY